VAALKTELPISYDRNQGHRQGRLGDPGKARWSGNIKKTTAEKLRAKGEGPSRAWTNVVTVKPKVQPSELKRKIMEAFKRNAEVDANRITVEANGSEGDIEKAPFAPGFEARGSGSASPGRRPASPEVEDRIVVSP